MKTAYIKPAINIQFYMVESTLLSSTNTSVIISGGGFPSIEGPITEVDDEGGEPSGGKEGGDFFEESISPRSLWDDEE